MPLTLKLAAEKDALRIADIHMAAFSSNEMLLAQFPTPAVRAELHHSIATKALDDIRDPHMAVLLVQESQSNGEVISFAKWSLPLSTPYNESPWRWPEGTRLDILDQWTQRVESAHKEILGNKPFYHLSFIGTDPKHERRGAATMLIKWALDRCSHDGKSAYLESTSTAYDLYMRLGFTPKTKISMVLPDGSTYEEIGFLFQPGKDVAKELPPRE